MLHAELAEIAQRCHPAELAEIAVEGGDGVKSALLRHRGHGDGLSLRQRFVHEAAGFCHAVAVYKVVKGTVQFLMQATGKGGAVGAEAVREVVQRE